MKQIKKQKYYWYRIMYSTYLSHVFLFHELNENFGISSTNPNILFFKFNNNKSGEKCYNNKNIVHYIMNFCNELYNYM